MYQVLLIDDNPGDVQLTRIAFQESGLPVALRAGSSLAEGREMLSRCACGESPMPALVLLDLNLGDGSGHELLAFMKSEPALAHVPAVVVTTSDYPRDRARAAELGAAGYVVKPNSFDAFIDIVRGFRWLLEPAPAG